MIVESSLRPEQAGYRRVVEAGDYWMHTLRKGQTLRILDLEALRSSVFPARHHA